MAEKNYKLPPPKAFSGKQEDWDTFSYRFKSYMVMRNRDYANLFLAAETVEHEITDRDFIVDGTDDLHEERVQLSHELHYWLVQMCEGTSGSILRQVDTLHGTEVWRRLYGHYKPSAATSAVGRLAVILEFSLSDSKFENDFVKWEAEINKFEKETASHLPDIVKTTILMNKTRGDIQKHVRLNAS